MIYVGLIQHYLSIFQISANLWPMFANHASDLPAQQSKGHNLRAPQSSAGHLSVYSPVGLARVYLKDSLSSLLILTAHQSRPHIEQ